MLNLAQWDEIILKINQKVPITKNNHNIDGIRNQRQKREINEIIFFFFYLFIYYSIFYWRWLTTDPMLISLLYVTFNTSTNSLFLLDLYLDFLTAAKTCIYIFWIFFFFMIKKINYYLEATTGQWISDMLCACFRLFNNTNENIYCEISEDVKSD